MQLVKPKTQHHPTLNQHSSAAYNSWNLQYILSKKFKICENIKIKRIKGCITDKALADI